MGIETEFDHVLAFHVIGPKYIYLKYIGNITTFLQLEKMASAQGSSSVRSGDLLTANISGYFIER